MRSHPHLLRNWFCFLLLSRFCNYFSLQTLQFLLVEAQKCFFAPRHRVPYSYATAFVPLYRSKTIPVSYRLLQYILQSTVPSIIPVPRHFSKKVPSTGSEVLFRASTEYRYCGTSRIRAGAAVLFNLYK